MAFTVLSLFSGGGGLDLGFFNQKKFEILWAIDNDKAAVDSYRKNIGNHIIEEDITKIDINKLPSTDIVIGGPPCQSFSLVGKRLSGDERGDLVWNYLNIIGSVKPKMFVFENVVGLKSAKNENGRKVIDELLAAFAQLGYQVKWEVLNAADYGVPQRRKRIFLVGMKANLEIKFKFPEPLYNEYGTEGKKKWISVEEALSDLGKSSEQNLTQYSTSPRNEYQKEMRKNKKDHHISDHVTPNLSELDKQIIKYVPVGGNYMNVPDYVPSKRIQKFKETGGRTTCYGRLIPDKPSYTINTHFNRPNVGCNIHYAEKRLITVREALRLQSFPDDYEIDSKTKRGKHTVVGNAVPPILASHIACEIINSLEKIDNKNLNEFKEGILFE